MTINRLLVSVLVSLILIGSVFAISQSDFQNVVFSENRGSANEASHGHVTYNIGKGWNLVPLKFMMGASGRYWGNFKEGQTCDQDIFQNVWYYSPVRGTIYHIPVMDDWGAPKTRNNGVLLNEFKAKYYHIYAGSGWVYSPKNCILEGDDGTSLVSGSYNDAEQEKGYKHNELILKAGWNLIPIDAKMVAFEKSIKDLFSSCNAKKFYIYDKPNNKWVDMTSEANSGNKIVPSDIFRTYLVKTTNDCNLADYEASSSSSPPAFPSDSNPSSTTSSGNSQISSSTNTFGFPQTIGRFNLIEARDKGPNAEKQCGNIEDHPDSAQSGLKGEICYEGLSLQYDDPANSQGLFVFLVRVTKGLDLYKALFGKFSKPVTVDGQQVFRLENHEIGWYTSGGDVDVVFTQEYTSKNKENGRSYSYGTATGDNDVTRYFLNKFKPN